MGETTTRRRLTIADLRPIERIEAQPPRPKPIVGEIPRPTKPDKPAKVAKPAPKPKAAPTPVARLPGGKTAAQIERRRRYRAKHAKPQPPWPEIAAMQAALAARYPAVFGEARPLAIGIHHQIMAEMGGDRTTLSAALRYWVAQSAYLRAVASGTHRHGLDGAPVAELNAAESADALKRLRDRGQQP